MCAKDAYGEVITKGSRVHFDGKEKPRKTNEETGGYLDKLL